ncbi:MAG: PEP-utilizing enzyme [Acidimicrobiales bacterium]
MGELARGAAIFGGATVRGRLRRFETPDDVIAMLDEGDDAPADVIALVNDAGATFLAPIEADLTGILCRSGDIESHLAIVSRDFRIPALMNVEFSADEPPDGSMVEIDCDSATLSLVED